MGAGAGRGGAHPLTRVRLALHPRLPPNKHTRSRAPAQRCTHACHLISTPTHVQHTPAALMSACSGWAGLGSGFGEVGVGWGTPAHTRPPSTAHILPPSKRTRSRVTDGVGYWGGGVGWGHSLPRAKLRVADRGKPHRRQRNTTFPMFIRQKGKETCSCQRPCPFLCIAVSTACTNDPGQKRPACRDDPVPRVQTIRIPHVQTMH